MSHGLVASVVLVLLVATSAHAQDSAVYKCANQPLYTDKPCAGARPVDVRPNILDAGPRGFPAVPPPQQQLTIIPDSRAQQQPASTGVFQNRDAQDAQFKARTGPF